MSFLAPLALFFFISVPFVILLYLLKLRRIDKPISSTLLWRQSLEDLKANTPFQKLKTSLLLFLQLLVLILLSLAVARPVLNAIGFEKRSRIMLVDISASMSSTDVSPSRLDQAKTQIGGMIQNLGSGESIMLIAFSEAARVLCPFSDDRRVLLSTLESIQPTGEKTDLEEAFQMALTAAKSQPNPEITIFSDGGFSKLKLDRDPEMPIHFVACGLRGENVGIVSVGTRRNFDAEGQYQISVTIRNSSSESKKIFVDLLSLPDPQTGTAGNVIDAREVSIEAGKPATLVFDDPGYYLNALEVRLDVQDDLPVDNHACVVLPRKEATKVLIVTTGNYFVERALNADPRTRVSTVPPNAFISAEGYDVAVFDQFVPPRLGPGRYLFLGCTPPFPDCGLEGEVEYPAIVDWDRFHPLIRYLEMSDLVVRKAKQMRLPSWGKVLVESNETPLMVLLETENSVSVATGFDLYESDWPLRASFPIFFMNLVDWFLSTDPRGIRLYATGDVLRFPPSETELAATVQLPSGKTREIRLQPDNPTLFADTSETGLYRLVPQQGEAILYACNLISAEETDTTPRTQFTAGTAEIEGVRDIQAQNREIWWPLAFAALLVFLLEWQVYSRKARYEI
ncbi:MAG TPA: BatA and WFA domain-containing protein [bacterium]|nr:BatA and WFA domain-containing protein [bacterium]